MRQPNIQSLSRITNPTRFTGLLWKRELWALRYLRLEPLFKQVNYLLPCKRWAGLAGAGRRQYQQQQYVKWKDAPLHHGVVIPHEGMIEKGLPYNWANTGTLPPGSAAIANLRRVYASPHGAYYIAATNLLLVAIPVLQPRLGPATAGARCKLGVGNTGSYMRGGCSAEHGLADSLCYGVGRAGRGSFHLTGKRLPL